MDEARLANIETQVARTVVLLESLTRKVEDHSRQSDERNDRLSRIIWGSNGDAGLLVKLDRLEQAAERSRWILRAVIGAIVSIVVGGIAAVL